MKRFVSLLGVTVLGAAALSGCSVSLPDVGRSSHFKVALSAGGDPDAWEPTRLLAPKTLELSRESSAESGLKLDAMVAMSGDPVAMTIDTGSSGVVISEQYLGDDYTSDGERFSDYVDGRGDRYSGVWVTASIQLDPYGASIDTDPVRVRVVTKMCPRDGSACESDPRNIPIAVLGVGYGRVGSDGRATDPTLNPLLAIPLGSGGVIHRGYVLTSDHLTIGVTDSVARGFDLVHLEREPASAGGEWRAPEGCVAMSGDRGYGFCGTLLVDSARPFVVVQAPDGSEPPTGWSDSLPGERRSVLPGHHVEVRVAGVPDSAIYSFSTDNRADDAWEVVWGHDMSAFGGEPSISTSSFGFSQFDYLYDADSGVVGFRSHGARR